MFFQSVIWLCGSLFPLSGPADRPPTLSFEKPVDYCGWLHRHLKQGRTENAAELYARLLPDSAGKGGFPEPSLEVKQRMDILMNGPVWVSESEPALAAYLRECESGFDVIQRAIQSPHCWFELHCEGKELALASLPPLRWSRSALRAMLAQAWIKQDNQGAKMLSACDTALRHANHIQGGGTLLHVLVGQTERIVASRAIRVSLDAGVLHGDDIPNAMEVLRTNCRHDLDLGWVFTTEWALTLDLLQVLCPGGHYDAGLAKRLVDTNQLIQLIGEIDPKATARNIDEFYEGLIKIVSGTLTRKTARKLSVYEERHAKLGAENDFLKLTVTAAGRPYVLLLRCEAEMRGTLLTIALHAYHDKHKEWPTKLKQFASEEIADERKDPVSDKPFVYKLEDGKPLLYSIGEDGEDNGGRHHRLWGEGEEGGDYVFWPFQRSE